MHLEYTDTVAGEDIGTDDSEDDHPAADNTDHHSSGRRQLDSAETV